MRMPSAGSGAVAENASTGMLIVNERPLETVIQEYCLHYNEGAPASEPQSKTAGVPQRSYPGAGSPIERSTRLGGFAQRLSLSTDGGVTTFSNLTGSAGRPFLSA